MLVSQSRYDTLDGLRGVAALAVALFHFTHYQSVNLFYNSPFAVDFFFMLSGFVIAHAYGLRLLKGMGLGEYALKRTIRLYPMFALGTLIGVPSLIALAHTGKAFINPEALVVCTALHAFFLPCFSLFGIVDMGAMAPTWGSLFPSNPPSWSLFFEMFAGLSFPLLCRLTTRSLLVFVAACWAIFMRGGFWLGSSGGVYSLFLDVGWGIDNFWIGFPRALFGFGCGVLLYRLRGCAPALGLRSWMLYLALGLALAFPFSVKGTYHALALTLFAPLMVFLGSATPCENKFGRNAARWLGRMSYPVYCLHLPIGRTAFLVAESFHLPAYGAIGFAVAGTLALSFLAVVLIDEPIRAWLSVRLDSSSHSEPR